MYGERRGGYGGHGGNRGGGHGGGFGGNRGGQGGGFNRGPREMHTVTCSDCGQETQVPFKPTEGRPVYCRDCYQKHKGERFERRPESNVQPEPEPEYEDTEDFGEETPAEEAPAEEDPAEEAEEKKPADE